MRKPTKRLFHRGFLATMQMGRDSAMKLLPRIKSTWIVLE